MFILYPFISCFDYVHLPYLVIWLIISSIDTFI